jgi:hypothetical protein
LRTNRARTIACLAGALLICVALAGCGRRGANDQTSAPQPTYNAALVSPSGSTDPGASGSPSDSASGADSGPTVPPTPDPVASELDQINQLINDINDSVQSSDSGGGE